MRNMRNDAIEVPSLHLICAPGEAFEVYVPGDTPADVETRMRSFLAQPSNWQPADASARRVAKAMAREEAEREAARLTAEAAAGEAQAEIDRQAAETRAELARLEAEALADEGKTN